MNTILAAVDFGLASVETVRSAFELAQAVGAKVHLLHVFRPLVIPTSRGLGDAALDDLAADRSFDALHADVVNMLHGLMAPYEGWSARGKAIAASGHPAQQILETADELEADLLMIGHRRPLFSRSSLADTLTHALVTQARCSVWISKPVV